MGAMAIALSVASCGSNNGQATTATDSVAASVATDGSTILSVDSTSFLNWKGRKPGGEHNGKIFVSNGSIAVQGDKLVSGTISINMSSIKDEDLDGDMAKKLEEHLESEDFFDVAKYPEAKFELTDIPEGGLDLNNLKEVKGNLTLKDVTKNISIPIASVVKDQQGAYTIKSGTFEIDRSQWNVKYGSKSFFTGLGDKFIENNIELSFEVKTK